MPAIRPNNWVPRSSRYVDEDSAEVGGRLANAKTEKLQAWERPPFEGLSVSGPVSRILSRAAICLTGTGAPRATAVACGPPGPRRAGSTVLLGLAPGGVCLAAASPRRRCALTAPFHLCLYATHVRSRHRPCVSVALSRGFPRVGVTHRPAQWCPDFPRSGFLSAPRSAPPAPPMVAPPRPHAQARDAVAVVPAYRGQLRTVRSGEAP